MEDIDGAGVISRPYILMDSIRISYLRGFTKLSLWYVARAVREDGSRFADIVNKQVNIYRNTVFYDGKRHPSRDPVGKEWDGLVWKLEGLLDARPSRFEADGLQLLWPHMEARLRQSEKKSREPPERPYECWSHDYRTEGRVGIHIDNVYRPRSPLSDMRVPFAASLIRLLEDSQRNRPDAKIVSCGSWMNSTPRFADLFPPGWPISAVGRPEIDYTMGHWGQFEDRKGDYHLRNRDHFRNTGELPFSAAQCKAPIDEVLEHVRTQFPEVVLHNQSRQTGEASCESRM